jgi:hypothetical protein
MTKLGPKRKNASSDAPVICSAIRPSVTSKSSADSAVARRNRKSPQFSSLPRRESSREGARISEVAGVVVAIAL